MRVKTPIMVAVVAVFCGLFLTGEASHAAILPYVDNTGTNLADWTAAVTGAGKAINSNVDFNALSLGNTTSITFYQATDGVTMGVTWSYGSATSKISNAVTGNASVGSTAYEGVYAPGGTERYLQLQPSKHTQTDNTTTTFTVDFADPVSAAGLKLIDVYAPYAYPNSTAPPIILDVFDGPNGTGTNLGEFIAPVGNWQKMKWFFVGVMSTEEDIESITIRRIQYDSQYNTTDLYGIDDVVFARDQAVPEPASIAVWSLLGAVAVFTAGWWRRKQAV
jgi:hypothetical protein